jgi:hypothetical protein
MLNLNYNIANSNLLRARFSEQEASGFRPFQIQYVLVSGGGGAAAGNNSFNSGSDVPKVGIAGNAGVIVTGSICVQPFITYPVIVGIGGKGGIATSESLAWTGSRGSLSEFYQNQALGGEGGKSQIYITASALAGSGSSTGPIVANGGSGSQWTYNLPGCLPTLLNPECHGGELISSSYWGGGGAGIVVSGSIPTLEIEYIVVGGGGGSMNNTTDCSGGTGYGGGGGAAITGSFIIEPIVKTYPISIGLGGAGTFACGAPNAFDGTGSAAFGVLAGGGQGANSISVGGNSGTGSWGLTTPFLGSSGGNGAGGAGAAGTGSIVVPAVPAGTWSGGAGGAGLQWVDGKYYAGGGEGSTKTATPHQGPPGITTQQFNYFPGRGAAGAGFSPVSGSRGIVVARYPGTGSKATGGIISYDSETNYTYHSFTASGNFVLNANTSSIFTSGLPGVGGGGTFSTSGSFITQNTGGGSAASYYNQNGVSGSDGFVAIRYQGAPLAIGGTIITTDTYTYHLFSSSADFYVIGQESNVNINPCGDLGTILLKTLATGSVPNENGDNIGSLTTFNIKKYVENFDNPQQTYTFSNVTGSTPQNITFFNGENSVDQCINVSLTGSADWPTNDAYVYTTMSLIVPETGFTQTSYNTASILVTNLAPTASNSYTITASVDVKYIPKIATNLFVLGAGGGGATGVPNVDVIGGKRRSGGGGGGGAYYNAGITVVPNTLYSVVVGTSGSGGTNVTASNGGNGQPSSIFGFDENSDVLFNVIAGGGFGGQYGNGIIGGYGGNSGNLTINGTIVDNGKLGAPGGPTEGGGGGGASFIANGLSGSSESGGNGALAITEARTPNPDYTVGGGGGGGAATPTSPAGLANPQGDIRSGGYGGGTGTGTGNQNAQSAASYGGGGGGGASADFGGGYGAGGNGSNGVVILRHLGSGSLFTTTNASSSWDGTWTTYQFLPGSGSLIYNFVPTANP